MDLVLNNLQRLIYHKTQTNELTNKLDLGVRKSWIQTNCRPGEGWAPSGNTRYMSSTHSIKTTYQSSFLSVYICTLIYEPFSFLLFFFFWGFGVTNYFCVFGILLLYTQRFGWWFIRSSSGDFCHTLETTQYFESTEVDCSTSVNYDRAQVRSDS